MKNLSSAYTNGRRPLRVLQAYRTYFPETQGGLQESIRQLCLGLRRHDVSTKIFTLAKNPTPRTLRLPEGMVVRRKSLVEVASCDIGSPFALAAFRRLASHADILHFHYPWPFADVMAAVASAGKPYVITYHSDIVRQRLLEPIYAPLRALFFRNAAAVVATSPTYAATSPFLSRLGRNLEAIPIGIDETSVVEPSVECVDAWRERFPMPFFLFVGVLRYYKGLDYLVAAAKRSGLHVVIAGDGPERERLGALAAGAPNVHFLGHISDVDKFALLQLARAVVFPSHLRAEAFGVTLLEGAICRKALISTDIGTGTSYVNIDRVTGFVVPPADVRALAEAMSNLADDATRAKEMGQAAYQRCVEKFDGARVGKQYFDLYRQVLFRQAPELASALGVDADHASLASRKSSPR